MRIEQGVKAREVAPPAVVRREIVPAQAALDGQVRPELPTILGEHTLLNSDPGRVVPETEFAVYTEVSEEGVGEGRLARGAEV